MKNFAWRTFAELFPHEFEQLLSALRRDVDSQTYLALIKPEYANLHEYNVRVSKRLLEALNPKRGFVAQIK